MIRRVRMGAVSLMMMLSAISFSGCRQSETWWWGCSGREARVLWSSNDETAADGESSVRPQAIVAFHQHWLERSWRSRQPIDLESCLVWDEAATFDSTDRTAVIRHVLAHTPERAIVYPSEQYYYFKFFAGHRLISGNLRFCDARQGKVHFGYFDQHDGRFLETGTIQDGVNGDVELDGQEVRLRFGGVERRFELNRSWETCEGLVLGENEALVSGILDESGYYFWLVYHPGIRRLFYVLNESCVPEEQSEIVSGGVRFRIGRYSRFIFFVEPTGERQILVGVQEQQVRENSYFDGPFDQVPPDLPLRPILEHVYPYVRERGGIDLHGNFLSERHARVAISPYVKYSETSEFLHQAVRVIWPFPSTEDRPLAFMDLVYESKMDFHRILQEASSPQEVEAGSAVEGDAPASRRE